MSAKSHSGRAHKTLEKRANLLSAAAIWPSAAGWVPRSCCACEITRLAIAGANRQKRRIRKDPVQFRVAIPAADPPGNITHMLLKNPGFLN
ncbi:hypothetical protein [Novosphingobium sp. BW1]|uniref:hypothetical protein n=1 Tax=Novosphingobium sp. BW1 TaxID=2592621 RepID=UPI0011DEE272|nr:hypothetical protein [Novosphingobium sp. BW1]TYC91242.1 hypothetical protein FMM79_04850 [Novosphingobium sp. BW1]